tara:strand:+ start:135 stop:266 length:132 start_codon:yes stop_codon:yes gene_type:complete
MPPVIKVMETTSQTELPMTMVIHIPFHQQMMAGFVYMAGGIQL